MPGADILIYTKQWCPYCAKAKALLRAKDLEWRELDVTFDERCWWTCTVPTWNASSDSYSNLQWSTTAPSPATISVTVFVK